MATPTYLTESLVLVEEGPVHASQVLHHEALLVLVVEYDCVQLADLQLRDFDQALSSVRRRLPAVAQR